MRGHEREVCDLCGEEIRIVGNTELLDGHICRDCADQLSPWFTDDLDCTDVEDIRVQLEGREQNLADLEDFHPNRGFGNGMRILVDDEAGSFCVTDSHDLMADNPDLLWIEDVAYVSVTPKKDCAEIGEDLYRYSYQFEVEIGMDAPEYISEIKFMLNQEPLVYESSEKGFLGFGDFDPEGQPDYDELAALGVKIEDVLNGDDDGSEDEGQYDIDENDFFTECEEEEPQENVLYAEGSIMKCPWCGANTRVGQKLTCEHCGGPL